jgi:alpha-beta hydrolase superfamily lysophospholipase
MTPAACSYWQSYRGRDVVIMGESFGGLLALGTAIDTIKKPIPGVTRWAAAFQEPFAFCGCRHKPVSRWMVGPPWVS